MVLGWVEKVVLRTLKGYSIINIFCIGSALGLSNIVILSINDIKSYNLKFCKVSQHYYNVEVQK